MSSHKTRWNLGGGIKVENLFMYLNVSKMGAKRCSVKLYCVSFPAENTVHCIINHLVHAFMYSKKMLFEVYFPHPTLRSRLPLSSSWGENGDETVCVI